MVNYLYEDTITYYNKNAVKFFNETVEVPFEENQLQFLSFLKGDQILDLGCGSGRDSKYFLEKGYCVTAVDGSKEMCRLAESYLNMPVQQLLFQEIKEKNRYDGIWACASVLHLSYSELKKILYRLSEALKEKGILYTSFKYGDFEGKRNERYFLDMTENKLEILLKETGEFQLIKSWITDDARINKSKEHWLNVILQKKSE